jgi:predicted RNA-binding Zn ribbon-like protein
LGVTKASAGGRATPVRRGGRQGVRGFEFELTGGALCLDLANTLDERKTERPRELLKSYDDLVEWGWQAGAISEVTAARLRSGSAGSSATASALARALEIREAIFQVFAASAGDRPVPAPALAVLNARLRDAVRHRRLVPDAEGRLVWSWEGDEGSPERVLWPVVLSAAELATSPERERVRECASPTCAWLFLDRSRNASRRWCDMTVCGNRAKARRHRSKSSREAG